MKLSDAILLGSTILRPRGGGQYYSEQNAGCALGMAAIAGGCGFQLTRQPVAEQEQRTLGTEGVWGQWVLAVVERPCNCWKFRVPKEMRIKDIIAHVFDRHIMRKKDWTLERLVAWVKTVEPAEDPLPKQNESLPAPGSPTWRLAKLMLRTDPLLLEEEREWQQLRQPFSAKYKGERRRGNRGTSLR